MLDKEETISTHPPQDKSDSKTRIETALARLNEVGVRVKMAQDNYTLRIPHNLTGAIFLEIGYLMAQLVDAPFPSRYSPIAETKPSTAIPYQTDPDIQFRESYPDHMKFIVQRQTGVIEQKSMQSQRAPSRQNMIGYLYVANSEQGVLRNASKNTIVENNENRPPWIVVAHAIESLVIGKWPGTLWEVEVIDEAENTGLLSGAAYTRANRIKILRKLPVSMLFGSCGDDILKIIESTMLLDLQKAETLAKLLPEEGYALYSKGWNIFGGVEDNTPPYFGKDHTQTLAISGAERRSPINCGFSLIYEQVFNKANELTNGAAILIDGDDVYLDPAWSKTCDAFLFAAMAVAYRDKYTKKEFETLTTAWRGVLNLPPTNRSGSITAVSPRPHRRAD